MLKICQMDKKGQATLVVVVLVMVVSLAVGVAASNRAVSNIRRATYTSQGDQALHCAESGAEEGLNRINEEGKDSIGKEYSATLKDSDGVDICDYSYKISEFSGKILTYPLVKQDDSQEINLEGYSGNLNLYFGSDDTASLEVTLVKGTSAPYEIEKYAYNCNESRDNGFDIGSSNGGEGLPCGTDTFSISGYKIARVRPLYADTKVVAEFSNTSPSQGYLIDSVGRAATAERNVRVVRSNPQLPAIFDYSIFSASETEPLSK